MNDIQNDEALSVNKSKLNDSRASIENQFKSMSKRSQSNTDIQLSKFAKLRSLHKKPLTENEDGNMIISANDFSGMGNLNNVK